MKPARRSLVRRLVATSAILILVALIVAALGLTALFRESVLRTLDDRLTAAVSNIVATAEPTEDGGIEPTRLPPDPRYERIFSGRYWQINRLGPEGLGPVVGNSRSVWDEPIEVEPRFASRLIENFGQPVTYDVKGPDRQLLRVIGQAIELPGDGGQILVLAAEDRRPADAEVRRFAMVSIGIFLVFGIALAAGVILQVRIGLGPVFAMQKAVADVREGRSQKVEGDFPVELQPLGDELNSLLDHSREVVERARTHVGNLAHALKTPIAVLINETSMDNGDLSKLVRRQTETMSRQVDHHLRRARAAAHAKAIGARCSVDRVVDDISRTLNKIYARQGKSVSAEGMPGLDFRGERQDLEEMVGNLADNACKWAASAVTIEYGVRDDGNIFISVEDDGPGMDAAQREQALKRGVRLDEEAPGTGLGLSIVVDLASVYGGELELGVADAGGLSARLILPGNRDK
ncbi:sensor histidine kinase [Hyphobacterium sp. HN65]|uniref:histidine kinase n=1 Tax=Hyphobacterium lacteum TaxID=3116575 RepID=A0ABU7LT31_9PROT|nr:sensor histidine kinase [Hyphobacterium sp. HN65]MEE2527061.1 sensor histidine kinase [Hyphobacterium sp. HN65]